MRKTQHSPHMPVWLNLVPIQFFHPVALLSFHTLAFLSVSLQWVRASHRSSRLFMALLLIPLYIIAALSSFIPLLRHRLDKCAFFFFFFLALPADVTASDARWRCMLAAGGRSPPAQKCMLESRHRCRCRVGRHVVDVTWLFCPCGGVALGWGGILSMFATINARNVRNARLNYASVFAGCYLFVST